jgi:fructose-1,6-bisphosphatase/inositol monophosphatase family enzyme
MSTKTNDESHSGEPPELLDYQAILSVAKEAAKLAGAEIQRVWWEETNSLVTKSNNVDLVTETDERAEELITELLQKTYPTHKIIGEESSGADCEYTLTDEPTWTIDPVDGTTNFVHRLGLSCVLVAFLYRKEVKVGVTYNPTSEELFWAIKGQGAFLETRDGTKRQIHVSKTTDIQQALIAMDPGYGRDDDSIHRYLSVQKNILQRGVRNVRTYGCCGLCLANVASGRFDAFFEEGSWETNTGPKIWDFCAGKLLIEEAGGVTRDVTNRASKDKPMDILQRSSFVAATPELADQILDIMYNSK